MFFLTHLFYIFFVFFIVNLNIQSIGAELENLLHSSPQEEKTHVFKRIVQHNRDKFTIDENNPLILSSSSDLRFIRGKTLCFDGPHAILLTCASITLENPILIAEGTYALIISAMNELCINCPMIKGENEKSSRFRAISLNQSKIHISCKANGVSINLGGNFNFQITDDQKLCMQEEGIISEDPELIQTLLQTIILTKEPNDVQDTHFQEHLLPSHNKNNECEHDPTVVLIDEPVVSNALLLIPENNVESIKENSLESMTKCILIDPFVQNFFYHMRDLSSSLNDFDKKDSFVCHNQNITYFKNGVLIMREYFKKMGVIISNHEGFEFYDFYKAFDYLFKKNKNLLILIMGIGQLNMHTFASENDPTDHDIYHTQFIMEDHSQPTENIKRDTPISREDVEYLEQKFNASVSEKIKENETTSPPLITSTENPQAMIMEYEDKIISTLKDKDGNQIARPDVTGLSEKERRHAILSFRKKLREAGYFDKKPKGSTEEQEERQRKKEEFLKKITKKREERIKEEEEEALENECIARDIISEQQSLLKTKQAYYERDPISGILFCYMPANEKFNFKNRVELNKGTYVHISEDTRK